MDSLPEPNRNDEFKPPITIGIILVTETVLLGLAFLLAAVMGLSFRERLSWHGYDLLLGAAATVPMIYFVIWSNRTTFQPIVRLGDLALEIFRKSIVNWKRSELMLISLSAGVAEELFFRGTLQVILTDWTTLWIGILTVNFVFAWLHAFSWSYFICAYLFGLYFSLLFIGTNNLLVPVMTHFLYDYYALANIRQRALAAERREASETGGP